MISKFVVLFVGALATQVAWAGDSSWTDRFTLGGDLRFEHDAISKTAPNDNAGRHRGRFRLRMATKVNIDESTDVYVRLSSGDSSSAISGNSAFTSNSTKKSIGIDHAYLNWHPSSELEVLVGKQKNPLQVVEQSQILFDNDYAPEGLAVVHESSRFFAMGAAYLLQERSPQADGTSEPDSSLLSVMAGVHQSASEGLGYKVGLGYHDFTNVKDNAALTSFEGNSNTGTRYVHEYRVAEALGQVDWTTAEWKLSVYVDHAHNYGAKDHNQALTSGLQWQTLRDGKADWTVGYAYLTLEKDATVASINWSDFADGEDGSNGHMVEVRKQLSKKVSFGIQHMAANIDNAGSPFVMHRTQSQLLAKF
ncbi:MAG: putative porin [Bdellovibrionales bacterium]